MGGLRRVTENRKTPTMRSFEIFSRWCHLLFSKSQFNSRNLNLKLKPNPNPKPNPNGMFEIRQSFKHPF